ncbi:uncharacterized protein PAC_09191 [Phialocephala subalpina]|uniref:Mei2-like C-terminal RNA recognition motif domain-containing protein n=1 Tax=Phialocephala subalpina TaxID=576137 RepID=A0A1L7X2Q0_9HELO|nr:uncharacterized protein PAC_09191 [Phialocephala subalpina]
MMPINFTPVGLRDGKTNRGEGMAGKQESPASERSERGSYAYHSMAATMTSPSYHEESDVTHDNSSIFSPNNRYCGGQAGQSTRGYNNNSGGGLSDPFGTTQPRVSLNATASAFEPRTVNRSAGGSTKSASRADLAVADSSNFAQQYLQNECEKNQRLVRSGHFTQETTASRLIKVVVDGRVQGNATMAVRRYLDHMRLQNRRSYHQADQVVVIQNVDITDATAIYKVLSEASAHLGTVVYVGASELGRIFPQLSGRVTDYEGELLVSARYPATATSSSDKADFEATIFQTISQLGSVYAFKTFPSRDDDHLSMQIELNNIEDVPRVVLRLNGTMVQGQTLSVEARHPDTQNDPYNYVAAASIPSEMATAMQMMSIDDPLAALAATPAAFGDSSAASAYAPPSNAYPTAPQGQAMGYQSQGMLGVVPQIMPMAYTPNGLAMVPYNGQVMMMTPLHPSQYGMSLQGGFANEIDDYGGPSSYNSYGRGRGRDSYRGSYGYRGSRGNNQRALMGPSDWHDSKRPENIVSIERIVTGMDVRTTVMLRNIPNKMTLWELIEIINKISRGRYDFVYLRIDFSNGCNVGYAFLNFVDPMDIVPFVRAIANRRWDDFKSDKIAEVSYATIQGRDCLIQKFRNSSVMLEEESCRPKLYYTEGHPLCGQEEPFPSSDNQSKLKRSCENAEHIGLFAPAHGQHYRQEQRNRNSLWDRGTTLADRERGNRLGFGESNRSNFDDIFRGNYNGGGRRGAYNGDRGGFDLVRSTAYRGGHNSERGGYENGRGGYQGGHNGERGVYEGGRGGHSGDRGGFLGSHNAGGRGGFQNGPRGGGTGGTGGFENGPAQGEHDIQDDENYDLAFSGHVHRRDDPSRGGHYRY